MDRRTSWIVMTIAASMLCGIPGITCLCFGLSATIISLDPAWKTEFNGSVPGKLVTSVALSNVCIGVLLIAIPIIVAIIYFRRHTPKPGLATDEPLPPPS